MSQFSDFEQLVALDQEVVSEIVREGELRLSSQFAAATAADQRALTIVGFQSAAATAAIGASIALLLSNKPKTFIIIIGFIFAFGLLFSAFKAIDTVRPKLFSFPGNFPKNWFPMDWISHEAWPTDKSLKRARIEQCYGINNAVIENEKMLMENARGIQFSIDFMFWLISCVGVVMFLYAIFVIIFPTNI